MFPWLNRIFQKFSHNFTKATIYTKCYIQHVQACEGLEKCYNAHTPKPKLNIVPNVCTRKTTQEFNGLVVWPTNNVPSEVKKVVPNVQYMINNPSLHISLSKCPSQLGSIILGTTKHSQNPSLTLIYILILYGCK